MIRITDNLSIPTEEISYTYTTSPKPGGQNVNRVRTRATLWFDVRNSQALNDYQRSRIRHRLATRIGKDGMLHISCWRHRTQAANRREALERFIGLLADAFKTRPVRKKTRPTRASNQRRIEDKRRRGRLKRSRSRPGPDSD